MQTNYPIELNSIHTIYQFDKESKIKNWFFGFVVSMTLILFLPWTQNIKSVGLVTALYPEHRPQEINSPIPGKIIKWYVKEGDKVKAGDTLLQIAEIKPEYLDPYLVQRTEEQRNAKQSSIDAYSNKIKTTSIQSQSLQQAQILKIQQVKNKIIQTESKLKAEKAELVAVENDERLAKDQYERQEKMFRDGLVSQTQLQQRSVSYQNALSKKIAAENKIQQTNQELINLRIEINSIDQDYTEKLGKVQGEQFSVQSQIENGKAELSKLENQIQNYKIRQQQYYIIAPQDGQVVQANKAGIGEIIKEEEHIVKIVPNEVQLAVEMFVRPVDLPLIDVGQKVRFQFDGYPAIVFSGWPNNSYGTFGGKIIAYENTIHPNGMFRVIVAEDDKDRKWPYQLKVGSGAHCIALLKNVPIWYELWRNINGFPPDYYKLNQNSPDNKKK